MTGRRSVAGMTYDETIVALSTVILAEVVVLDDVYEALGIAGIGGIAGGLQPTRPPFIVSDLQGEESLVALARSKETGMVFKRLVG